jgi:hypothetical protein
MSDEPIPETTNTSVPKTATDLAIEKLSAELAELKKQHAEQVKQLEDANKSLWAAAHPAPVAQVTESQPAPSAGFDFEKAEDAFYSALGKPKE